MTERMPNTFLIGAGPVATALAAALRAGGVPVLGLWARGQESALAAGTAAGVASFSGGFPPLLAQADVVVLAVRDDAVAEVAQRLVEEDALGEQAVLLHCSGAKPSGEVFAAVRDRLGGIGTLHPLRAIAEASAAARAMPGTVFGVEGDRRGRAVAGTLVAALGGRPLALDAAQMPAYHAAAAMASNYVVALLESASAVLAGLGMTAEEAAAALLPLARGSLDNVESRGPVGGLTGPIRRGDRATVERHLASLPADLVPVYRELGLRTVEIARRAGDADPADLAAIAAILRAAQE